MYGRRMTRDFYRPSEALGAVMEVSPDVPGSEIYRYTNMKGEPVAEVFGGKRAKPDWYFRFPNEERREEKIAEWIENQKSRAAAVKTRRKEANAGHTLKVGDLMSSSWGYDQTNVDFYEVTAVLSKSFVEITKIGGKAGSPSSPPCDYVRPNPGHYIGEPMKKKAGPDNYISLNSYSGASLTSADHDHYKTSWGWGH